MAIINCPECKKEISDIAITCPSCGFPLADYLKSKDSTEESTVKKPIELGSIKGASHNGSPRPLPDTKSNMKTWKLVSGILSMIFFAFVTFQSCAVGITNAISENEESSGTAGVLVAIMMLTGGIVSVAARNNKKGGNIALVVLFGIGALIGFVLHGNYTDLVIWAMWCSVNAILALVNLG